MNEKTETLKELFEKTKEDHIRVWTKKNKSKINKAPNNELALTIYFSEFNNNVRYKDWELRRYRVGDFLYHYIGHFKLQIGLTEDYVEAINNANAKMKEYLKKEPDEVKKVGVDFINSLSKDEKIKLIAKEIAYEDYNNRYMEIHQTKIITKPTPSEENQISYTVVIEQLAFHELIKRDVVDSLNKLLNKNSIYTGEKIDWLDYPWKLYFILCFLYKSNLISIDIKGKKGLIELIISSFTYNNKPIEKKILNDKIKKATDQSGKGTYLDFITFMTSIYNNLGLKSINQDC